MRKDEEKSRRSGVGEEEKYNKGRMKKSKRVECIEYNITPISINIYM